MHNTQCGLKANNNACSWTHVVCTLLTLNTTKATRTTKPAKLCHIHVAIILKKIKEEMQTSLSFMRRHL